MKKTFTRRGFIRTSLLTAAAAGWSARSWSQVRGANEDIRAAVIGFHGQGKGHISAFRGLKGVRLVALCDADQEVLEREAGKLREANAPVETYTDVRKLLANQDIDVISTATPNHWHALISIWACQAGKDVYVEKPVSHNVWEGRKIVEAARKYQRIVQTGTQCRSNPGLREAMQYLHEGNLGKIRIARGLCYKRRASIGKVTDDQPVPPSIDYDLWTGPAPLTPLRRKRLHYDWHWVWPTGNGDLGNQGIHQMDMARWALQIKELSPKVFSVGGRFGYQDDGETPNTQIILHDYGDKLLIFEVRGLPQSTTVDKMDSYRGASIGVVVHCEGGYLVIPSYASATAFDSAGQVLKKFDGSANHFENFIQAVRSRRAADLHADILEGHLSSALCHTGNISYRLGQQRSPERIEDALRSAPEMLETCERAKEHLAANQVDLDVTPAAMGVWLQMDPKTERFTNQEAANVLLSRPYRKPYVVPEVV